MESVARLKKLPISPRKTRLVADLIRGLEVVKALHVLRYEPKSASGAIEKLLRSAVANWQQQHVGASIGEVDLYVKEIRVDGASMLKRIKPAPQGRAHRIRRRSNHITLVVGARVAVQAEFAEGQKETQVKEIAKTKNKTSNGTKS